MGSAFSSDDMPSTEEVFTQSLSDTTTPTVDNSDPTQESTFVNTSDSDSDEDDTIIITNEERMLCQTAMMAAMDKANTMFQKAIDNISVVKEDIVDSVKVKEDNGMNSLLQLHYQEVIKTKVFGQVRFMFRNEIRKVVHKVYEEFEKRHSNELVKNTKKVMIASMMDVSVRTVLNEVGAISEMSMTTNNNTKTFELLSHLLVNIDDKVKTILKSSHPYLFE